MWKRIGSDITPWTSESEWQRVLATLTGSKDRRGSSFVRRKIWGHWGIYASGYTDDRYQWHLELQEWSSLSWRGSSRATELEVMEESSWLKEGVDEFSASGQRGRRTGCGLKEETSLATPTHQSSQHRVKIWLAGTLPDSSFISWIQG